ncbi:sigma-70 family RNA polymerase sigma factor [Paenibacillus sp. LMG 31456]|uniref:Sigma-70 family RNA polymerase sigma factor n=1 Tax=Paenibacillus foliorum TaxID=2654974 RepID=A0A972GWA1_9BACL|nr:RNA polymerase sigma factor [Paenibacillus foliorum]NOU98081.1 sigma-70 family RNA polymerase sigma factor [Paenibacillus foliorum]
MDWKPILYQYSMRITGNRWDADDLTQDAWFKVVEAVRNNPERPITRAFLYRVARNAWIDVQRKQKIRTVPFDRSYEAAAPDPLLSSRELLEQLAERLSPKMAVILLLMDVFDFTAKETAEFVRMKEATVQVTLGRARLRLKQFSQDSSSDRPSIVPNEDRAFPIDFDGLVEAFRRRDPDAIYRAYIGLTKEEIHLTQLQTVGALLHFTFRDPDGNIFRVVSN